MDGFWYHLMGGYFYGWMWIAMAIVWVIQLIIGFFVYRDAKKLHRLNPLLWFILVIIPMIGWIFLIIYLVIRETGSVTVPPSGKSALQILDERYAKGEISEEEYQRMKEHLQK